MDSVSINYGMIIGGVAKSHSLQNFNIRAVL